MGIKIHAVGNWLLHYDRKAGLWVGFHKKRSREEWNAYTKDDLLWNIGHFETPGCRHTAVRQVVKR